MLKMSALAAVVALLAVVPAQAACPSKVPGSSSEAIAANSERILCLQREAGAIADQQELDLNIMRLERSVQTLQLQRRFDQLPPIQMYVPPN